MSKSIIIGLGIAIASSVVLGVMFISSDQGGRSPFEELNAAKDIQPASNTRAEKLDLESPLGFRVTTGAAAGYVADVACAKCHTDLYKSYQDVGMAKSFSLPTAENYIANFNAKPFLHKPSNRYYLMRRQGDDISFKRYEVDSNGKEINVFEQKVDWMLGSGNKTRSYLYQTTNGKLFLLPVDWYSETNEWQIHPGFEGKNDVGVVREVKRECMFCHNAYPQVDANSDIAWKPHVFPSTLPHGIGCQRCHGPGATHIRTVLAGEGLEAIHGSITNPAKLPVDQRDSVCFQCHLLPAASLVGQRRFNRNTYSFRPGESLSDYMLHVDVQDRRQALVDRFEINHHAYRLRQSACFTKSEGALSCISCHNPHRKVAESERVAHFSAACLGCHEAHEPKTSADVTDSADCAGCHMPQRRTQDVIHAVMTDHLIQRNSGSAKRRLELVDKRRANIVGLDFLMPEKSPVHAQGDVYKAVSVLKSTASAKFVTQLQKQLPKSEITESTPWLELANSQIKLKQYQAAEKTLNELFKHDPNNPKAQQIVGIAYLAQGKLEQAEVAFNEALIGLPTSADLLFNYGLLKLSESKYLQAKAYFERAVAQQHNLAIAWHYLGYVSNKLEQNENAVMHFKQALKIEPSLTQTYIALTDSLLQLGNKKEAARYLNHGVVAARNSELIKSKIRAIKHFGKK